MKILKLIASGLVAYTAFELIRGFSGSPRQQEGREGGEAENQQGQSPAQGADQNRQRIGEAPTTARPTGEILETTAGQLDITGGGMDVETVDRAGTVQHHRVGRGVVSR